MFVYFVHHGLDTDLCLIVLYIGKLFFTICSNVTTTESLLQYARAIYGHDKIRAQNSSQSMLLYRLAVSERRRRVKQADEVGCSGRVQWSVLCEW